MPSTEHDPQRLALRRGIGQIMAETPDIRFEHIRVSGAGGMREMLQRRGINCPALVIREELRALGLKCSGRGPLPSGVRSREHLDHLVHQVVSANPRWMAGGVTVRGEQGLKAQLAARGHCVNQMTLVRSLQRLGYATVRRGYVPIDRRAPKVGQQPDDRLATVVPIFAAGNPALPVSA